jgi:hypothetical protein
MASTWASHVTRRNCRSAAPRRLHGVSWVRANGERDIRNDRPAHLAAGGVGLPRGRQAVQAAAAALDRRVGGPQLRPQLRGFRRARPLPHRARSLPARDPRRARRGRGRGPGAVLRRADGEDSRHQDLDRLLRERGPVAHPLPAARARPRAPREPPAPRAHVPRRPRAARPARGGRQQSRQRHARKIISGRRALPGRRQFAGGIVERAGPHRARRRGQPLSRVGRIGRLAARARRDAHRDLLE